MEQKELFSTSDFQKVPQNGKTCNDCKHRQRWQCGGSVFQYCGLRKSNRTENGLLKIKCKDLACLSFEQGIFTNKSKNI